MYASCCQRRKGELWDQLKRLDSGNFGQLVGGDFNIVRSNGEKIGRLFASSLAVWEFNNFIHEAGMFDIPSTGSKLSWCNGRQGTRRIWARLDRILITQNFNTQCPSSSISYLD